MNTTAAEIAFESSLGGHNDKSETDWYIIWDYLGPPIISGEAKWKFTTS
jgi:hypothetical protein